MADRRRMDPRALGLSEEDLRQLGFAVRSRGPGPEAPLDDDAPQQRPTPRRRRLQGAALGWLATVVLLLASAWGASPGLRLPAPVPAAGPDTAFSSARALAQLVELAQRPHPTGSPEHDRVRDRIAARLLGLGLEPEIQTAVVTVRDSTSARAATVRNVVARIPGSASTGTVALLAHYDAAPLSPGAADDAMGVAAVLEAARVLLAGPPPRNDIAIVLTDAGALDGLGARAFAEQHPLGVAVAVAISVEVAGGAGAARTFQVVADGVRPQAIADAAVGPGSGSLAGALLGPRTHPELAPFVERGAQGVGLTTLGNRARRHRPVDVAAEVDEASLQDLGQQLVAVARAAAGADLSVPSDARAGATASLALPRLGVVRHTVARAWIAGGALAAVWVLLAALALRVRGASPRGVAVGIGVGAGVVVAGAALGGLAFDWVSGRHPELGTLDTALYWEAPHAAALAALALMCASAAHALARRWFRADELLTGALAPTVAAAVWVTVAEPAVSAAVQWPLAAALLALGLVVAAGEARAGAAWARAVVVALTALALLVLAPALELVAEVWTLRSATGLGALFALGALLLLPALEGLRAPRPWLAPAAFTVAAALLVALSLPSVRGSVRHPVPTALVYLTDEPAPSRLPAGAPAEPPDSTGARRMAGEWLIVPGRGERWARSWVVEPAVGTTDPGVVLLPEAGYVVAGTGPESMLSPPRARVLASALEGGRRRVRIALAPGLAGEMLGLHLPDASTAELTAVAGTSLTAGPAPVRTLEHWGRPEGGELVVELAVAPERTELDLVVVEHHLRPREVLIEQVFERPDSLVPNVAAGSDRVIQRTPLRVSFDEDGTTRPQ